MKKCTAAQIKSKLVEVYGGFTLMLKIYVWTNAFKFGCKSIEVDVRSECSPVLIMEEIISSFVMKKLQLKQLCVIGLIYI